jgi:hypothetical protein
MQQPIEEMKTLKVPGSRALRRKLELKPPLLINRNCGNSRRKVGPKVVAASISGLEIDSKV